jgi:PIN domain nuclease of toxin-antitoxin system
LDTCAAIWLAKDDTIAPAALKAVDQTFSAGLPVFLSPMTAWEIGLLNARGRLTMSMSPQAWFDTLLKTPGVTLAELSVSILIASSFLPGSPPRDPADRIIVATAREYGLRLVTRDRVLLDYGSDGHLDVLAC